MSLDLQVFFKLSQKSIYFDLSFLSLLFGYFFKWICSLYWFQVLINGLQHFVPTNVRPKFQAVETFIKVSKRAVLIFSSKINWQQIKEPNKLIAVWSLSWTHPSFVTWLLTAIFFLHNTGLLSSRNWICALGTCSSGKKILPQDRVVDVFAYDYFDIYTHVQTHNCNFCPKHDLFDCN